MPHKLNQSAPPSPVPSDDGEPLVTVQGGADTDNNATPWNNLPRAILKRALKARTEDLGQTPLTTK